MHPESACAECRARGACSDALMSWGDGERTVEARNALGARIGDTVVLDVAPRAVVASAAMLYLFPALAGIAGAAVGAAWGERFWGLGPDASAGILFGACLVLALLVVRAVSPRLAARRSFQVSIVEIVSGGAGSEGLGRAE